MATLGKCRFCGRISAAHTHDECVEEYGSKIEKSILQHYSLHPSLPLPSSILEQVQTEDWNFYSQWKQRREELSSHMESVKKAIKRKAEEILSDNRANLKELATPFGHRTFEYYIQCEVNVKITPQC